MRWRARHEDSWTLLGLAIVLAIVGVLVDMWKGPSALLMSLAVLSAAGAILLTRLTSRAKRRDVEAVLISQTTRSLQPGVRDESVKEVEFVRWGVHPPLVNIPYQRRDAETDLEPALRRRVPTLVVGTAMSGKSRLCAETLRGLFGDLPLVIPSPPDGLARLLTADAEPEGVLWLDDLERFLSADQLRPEWLDRMSGKVVVVATMQASDHARYTSTALERLASAEVVERFKVVRLTCDDAERRRLAECGPDQGSREGIRRYGLAEFLGGGHLVLQRFADGISEHPLGAALVSAAVDWRRLGLDGIPSAIAETLTSHYLPETLKYDPGEDQESARAWATAKITWNLRMLDVVEGGALRAADYLVDHVPVSDGGMPDALWEAAIVHLSGGSTFATQLQRVTVADAATQANRPQDAERLYRQVLDSGDPIAIPGAQLNLGVILERDGRRAEALTLYRLASESPFQGRAAAMAAVNLGLLLEQLGDSQGAVTSYERAEHSGDADEAARAACSLGHLIRDSDPARAAAAYRRCIAHGRQPEASLAAYNLGSLLEGEDDRDGAVVAYRQALESTDLDRVGRAGFNLGLLLERGGDLMAAEAGYAPAAFKGTGEGAAMAAVNLASLRLNRTDIQGAADAYRAALATGCSEVIGIAARGLGLALHHLGDLDGAADAFWRAESSGHPDEGPRAAIQLGALLTGRRDFTGARQAYSRATCAADESIGAFARRALAELDEAE